MTVKIITDSLGDIPAEQAEKLGITVIPINVIFGNINYRDGVDLTTEQFYDKLAASKIYPATIVPPLGRFADTYDKVAEETGEIVVVTSSNKLTASYDTALLARERMKKKCRVEVIDSLSAIMAQGLIVMAAAKAAQEGARLDKILEGVRNNIPRAHTRMAFGTLEYLRRGGRIGKAKTFLGTVLKVSPILGIRDGEVYPFAREHSRARAIDYLYDFADGFTKIEGIGVEDATTPDEADELANRLQSRFPGQTINRSRVSPVVGAHVGPRVLGVAVLGDRDQP
jgi:DegV family protein with EDD domain